MMRQAGLWYFLSAPLLPQYPLSAETREHIGELLYHLARSILVTTNFFQKLDDVICHAPRCWSQTAITSSKPEGRKGILQTIKDSCFSIFPYSSQSFGTWFVTSFSPISCTTWQAMSTGLNYRDYQHPHCCQTQQHFICHLFWFAWCNLLTNLASCAWPVLRANTNNSRSYKETTWWCFVLHDSGRLLAFKQRSQMLSTIKSKMHSNSLFTKAEKPLLGKRDHTLQIHKVQGEERTKKLQQNILCFNLLTHQPAFI